MHIAGHIVYIFLAYSLHIPYIFLPYSFQMVGSCKIWSDLARTFGSRFSKRGGQQKPPEKYSAHSPRIIPRIILVAHGPSGVILGRLRGSIRGPLISKIPEDAYDLVGLVKIMPDLVDLARSCSIWCNFVRYGRICDYARTPAAQNNYARPPGAHAENYARPPRLRKILCA